MKRLITVPYNCEVMLATLKVCHPVTDEYSSMCIVAGVNIGQEGGCGSSTFVRRQTDGGAFDRKESTKSEGLCPHIGSAPLLTDFGKHLSIRVEVQIQHLSQSNTTCSL